LLTIQAICFDFSGTAVLRKTTLKCKIIKVTLYRISIQCRSEISVLQTIYIVKPYDFVLFVFITWRWHCKQEGISTNKLELTERKILWIQCRKHTGISHTKIYLLHSPSILQAFEFIFWSAQITQCDKRLRLWNAKCMRRYKTHLKKCSCQGKDLVTGSQRLYALPYLCMKVRHEV
jgi:hypothetical protein